MSENPWTFKTMSGKLFLGVAAPVISGFFLFYIFKDKPLSPEEVKKKIWQTLTAYSEGLNTGSFDAYKYFASDIILFYQMKDTRPKQINYYVNGQFREQFKNAKMWFDEQTIIAIPS